MNEIQPQWEDKVPWCDDCCQSHDGKRCAILGGQPGSICQPAVEAMADEIEFIKKPGYDDEPDLDYNQIEEQFEFAEEVLRKRGLRDVQQLSYGFWSITPLCKAMVQTYRASLPRSIEAGELPAEGQRVRCEDKYGNQYIAFYDEGDFMVSGTIGITNISHWWPTTEVPK